MSVVETASGRVRGSREGAVSMFRGVPFAATPTGRLRFRPPVEHEPWSGERDATRNGPVAPQPKSRLADVMGDCPIDTGEDCLTLTIATPAADAKRRPVLVWLHGGAFSSGAGSLDWYSGAELADRGDIVVVGVNYRLGALGFLYAPGLCEGNLGLRDQLAALRWIQANIHAFGGDPDAITIFGQSAGAMSIVTLMTVKESRGLFSRAILQSPAMSRITRSATAAAEIGADFLQSLGVRTVEELQAVPLEEILRVQIALSGKYARFADAAPLFCPVIDGSFIARDPLVALQDTENAGVDLLMGSTREESAAFCAIDPRMESATAEQIDAAFEREYGAEAQRQKRAYLQRRPGAGTVALMGDMLSDRTFRDLLLEFALWRAANGRPAYLYQFDWAPRSAAKPFGACHCIELPFVFGYDADVWKDAPMLGDATEDEIRPLSTIMQDAWIAFARTGRPEHDALPAWPRYDAGSQATMRFDRVVGPVSDLAGMRYR